MAPLAAAVPQLLERTVRIEEELKAQRELMRTQFAASDRRFGDMNNRFEDLTKYVDKRFTSLQWSLGGALVLLTTLMSIYQFVA